MASRALVSAPLFLSLVVKPFVAWFDGFLRSEFSKASNSRVEAGRQKCRDQPVKIILWSLFLF